MALICCPLPRGGCCGWLAGPSITPRDASVGQRMARSKPAVEGMPGLGLRSYSGRSSRRSPRLPSFAPDPARNAIRASAAASQSLLSVSRGWGCVCRLLKWPLPVSGAGNLLDRQRLSSIRPTASIILRTSTARARRGARPWCSRCPDAADPPGRARLGYDPRRDPGTTTRSAHAPVVTEPTKLGPANAAACRRVSAAQAA